MKEDKGIDLLLEKRKVPYDFVCHLFISVYLQVHLILSQKTST